MFLPFPLWGNYTNRSAEANWKIKCKISAWDLVHWDKDKKKRKEHQRLLLLHNHCWLRSMQNEMFNHTNKTSGIPSHSPLWFHISHAPDWLRFTVAGPSFCLSETGDCDGFALVSAAGSLISRVHWICQRVMPLPFFLHKPCGVDDTTSLGNTVTISFFRLDCDDSHMSEPLENGCFYDPVRRGTSG